MHASQWAIDLCKRYDVSYAAVIGSKLRTPMVVQARHEIWCIIVDTFGLSQPEAAKLFEVDRTSIKYALDAKQAVSDLKVEVTYGHDQPLH
jgi:hypothetical protein